MAAVMVFALVAVNLGNVSVVDAGGKDRTSKKSAEAEGKTRKKGGKYEEKGGPSLFWD